MQAPAFPCFPDALPGSLAFYAYPQVTLTRALMYRSLRNDATKQRVLAEWRLLVGWLQYKNDKIRRWGRPKRPVSNPHPAQLHNQHSHLYPDSTYGMPAEPCTQCLLRACARCVCRALVNVRTRLCGSALYGWYAVTRHRLAVKAAVAAAALHWVRRRRAAAFVWWRNWAAYRRDLNARAAGYGLVRVARAKEKALVAFK